MEKNLFFNQCKELAGNKSDKVWTEDDLAGFFQLFYPDGSILKTLFDDIPNGTQVYDRVCKVYELTGKNHDRNGQTYAYFVVQDPEKSDSESLLQNAKNQLKNWRAIAEEVNDKELVSSLTSIQDVSLSTTSPPPSTVNTFSLDDWIYEVQSDWFVDLTPICPHAHWMREAFYHIDCDYYLAGYLMWPWYQDDLKTKQPCI